LLFYYSLLFRCSIIAFYLLVEFGHLILAINIRAQCCH